jgi:uncharacterized membrane protein YeaQ/YmgE (transglycosylase-associated protein family)
MPREVRSYSSIELYKVNCQTLGYTRDVPKATAGGKSMFHLIWYVLIGLVSGVIAKSVMHVHIAIFWTIVLGIIGSIIGGGVSHMFSRPTNERYHPAGLIFPHWARCWFFSFAIS